MQTVANPVSATYEELRGLREDAHPRFFSGHEPLPSGAP